MKYSRYSGIPKRQGLMICFSMALIDKWADRWCVVTNNCYNSQRQHFEYYQWL